MAGDQDRNDFKPHQQATRGPRHRIDALPARPLPSRTKNQPERSAVGKCTKLTFFFWNFLLFMVSLALTSLGGYILYIKDKRVNDMLDFLLDPACDVTLSGAVVTVVGALGAWGSLRENTACLRAYYMILSALLLCELVLAVLMFVAYYVPDAKAAIFPEDTFRSAIRNYRNDPDMQHLIDSLQTDLGCCGLSDSDSGFLDWQDNVYFNCTPASSPWRGPEACSVPFSCCRTLPGDAINYECGANTMKLIAGTVTGNPANTYRIYTEGCVKALGAWIEQHSLSVAGAMLGVLLPQVFVIVFTRNLIEMIMIQKSFW